MRWRLGIVLLLACAGRAHAQQQAELPAHGWSLSLAEVPVFPPSIQVLDSAGRVMPHSYDVETGVLTWGGHPAHKVVYRQLPEGWVPLQQRPTPDLSLQVPPLREQLSQEWYQLPQAASQKPSTLAASGSLSRGVSIGNQQNVFVRSALDLRLEGQLTDGLYLEAQITDQEIPFQPEGNTQQLQEFDRIYLSLRSERLHLQAGDIRLGHAPAGGFLAYQRFLQGIALDYTLPTKLGTATTHVGMAQAQGSFATQDLEVTEGVMGPYRIVPPTTNGLAYVLAGTEQVFLDGRLLERGTHYTIDYNLGELTFSPSILLTVTSRVRLAYEYADRAYPRTVFTLGHRQTLGKRVEVGLNLFTESDNRFRPLAFEASAEDLDRLSNSGDAGKVYVPAVDSVGFQENAIRYRKVQGEAATYYEYSTNPAEAHFRLAFTQVGLGRGDYRLAGRLGAGRYFEYAGPGQGDYAPVLAVSTPLARTMWQTDMAVQVTNYEQVKVLGAFSKRNTNTFNPDQGIEGVAGAMVLSGEGRPLAGSKLKVSWQLSHQQTGEDFAPVDPYRAVDFERDWGFTTWQDSTWAADAYSQAALSLATEKGRLVHAAVHRRHRADGLQGWRQELQAGHRLGPWEGSISLWNLASTLDGLNAAWWRQESTLRRHGDWATASYTFRQDQHQLRNAQDSLLSSLMNFTEHVVRLQQGVKGLWRYQAEYRQRQDHQAHEGQLQPQNLSHTVVSGVGRAWDHHELNTTFTWRENHLKGPWQHTQAENTLQGEVRHTGQAWKKAITWQVDYGVGTGRELRREFIYVQVPVGQGTHTWRDDNGDGQQDIGEFYPAVLPDEMEYVRMFMPTTEFLTAYVSSSNGDVRLQSPEGWLPTAWSGRWVQGLSWRSQWHAEHRTSQVALHERLNPWSTQGQGLLGARLRMQSRLEWQGDQQGWHLLRQWHHTQTLLTEGFDTRNSDRWAAGGYQGLGKQWRLALEVDRQRIHLASDFLAERNFALWHHQLRPSLTWMWGQSGQVAFHGSYARRASEADQPHPADHWEVGLGLNHNHTDQSRLQAQLRWVKLDYDGLENNALGYELTQALRPGANALWQLQWQQRLMKHFQLNLIYNGRTAPNTPTVHTGTVMATAFF